LRARGERNLILCFLYTSNRPPARARAPPSRYVLPVFIATERRGRRGPSGRATPASKRFRRRFHGASGWHSAEATWWLPRRLTLRLFCIALRSNSRPRVRLSRDNGTHYPSLATARTAARARNGNSRVHPPPTLPPWTQDAPHVEIWIVGARARGRARSDLDGLQIAAA